MHVYLSVPSIWWLYIVFYFTHIFINFSKKVLCIVAYMSDYIRSHISQDSRQKTWIFDRVLIWLCACVLPTYDSSSSQFFAQKELSNPLSENTGCSVYNAANDLGKPLLGWNYRGIRLVCVSTVASYIEGPVLNILDLDRTAAFRVENRKSAFLNAAPSYEYSVSDLLSGGLQNTRALWMTGQRVKNISHFSVCTGLS